VGTIAYLSGAVSNAPVNVSVTSFTARPTGGAPTDQPPVARFAPECEELACSFDATGSSDPDGTIASYAWDFGDGSTGSGRTLSHAYVVPGYYPVTLTVTDDAGATATMSQVVTATPPPDDQPPTARFTWSCTGLTCGFDGTTSSDPEDGSVTGYSWDLGDGSTSTQSSFTHTFDAPGTYDVTLIVADDDDATGEVTHELQVTAGLPDQLPVAVLSGSCGGLSCSFDGSGSWDPDGSVVSYGWSFGDGGSGGGVSASHVYAVGGPVTVTLTVTDDQGGSSSVSRVFSPVAAVGSAFVSDGFGRSVVRGFGSADVGGVWSSVGTAAQFSVVPGAGVLSLVKAPQQLEGFVGSAQTDADVS
jgi:PKD repeat protein